jgi:ABC-type multidrug transport system permease subunit
MKGGVTLATYNLLMEVDDYIESMGHDYLINIGKISRSIDYYMFVIRDIQEHIESTFIDDADNYFEKLKSISIFIYSIGLLIFISIFLVAIPYLINTLNTRMYQTKRLLGMLPINKMMEEIEDMKKLFAKLT